ncbi:MAG: NTP transferase domain-containing protein [Clostridia bacterium]|nr:NTP transferase domain-containing protein [Clostridia bacterium]
MLQRKQFDIMTELEAAKRVLTQRELAAKLGVSVGTVNKTLNELDGLGFISEGKLTEKGLDALEPYKVKRAVFIAAGFGSRLVPVTLNTPKPLVRVNGKRIIDGLIDAVLAAGIEEIIIVRGYLAEQFDQLLYKYPMIKFIENPAYNEANNISSAMCARYLLSNAYVFEADLLIYNPAIIKKYHYCSNFLGIKKDRTDDWCFEVKDGVIKEQKVGGIDCYQEVGISYWDDADGRKLSEHIKQTYDMPGGKERYWDQVPFVFFPREYSVEIRECKQEDIIEIDTFKELKAIDKTYDV